MKTQRICVPSDWLLCGHGGLIYTLAIGAIALGVIFYLFNAGILARMVMAAHGGGL